MQIFEYDYIKGKGKKLADQWFSGTGQGLGILDNKVVYEYFMGKVTPDSSHENERFTADDFGSRAITCCTGKVDGKWEWIIVCNKADAKKAKERNLKKFGHEHWKFK